LLYTPGIENSEAIEKRGITMSRTIKLAAVGLLMLGVVGCGDDGDSSTVNIAGAHSLAVGQNTTLTATTVAGSDSSYTWTVDDAAVATVDASGVVTAVAPGEAMITARGMSTSAVGSHVIVVGQALVTVMGNTTVPPGNTSQLTATTWNGADDAYTWTSSDEVVATVDDTGLVTGMGVGTATISATGSTSGLSADVSFTVAADVPNYEAWAASGHADSTAEAFRHWDGDDPREVPATCAKCHSSPGFQDFIGEDGSMPGQVDQAAPVGTVYSPPLMSGAMTLRRFTVARSSSNRSSPTLTRAVSLASRRPVTWGAIADV
jgi:hypothetical protein